LVKDSRVPMFLLGSRVQRTLPSCIARLKDLDRRLAIPGTYI